ncbi:MAG TPA: HAMP domain-containing sensor histidine kinase [Polyangia bacterium]|nr:HAMP domain-containing sensor histidine kinase [Polyangia bacterium]
MELGGADGRRERMRRRRARAGAGYALVLATLVIPSGLAVGNAFRAAKERDHVAASFTLAAARAERLRTLGLEVGLDVRALIIRDEPARRTRFGETKDDFDRAVSDLRAQARPEGESLLMRIDQAALRYEDAVVGVLALPAPERDDAFEAKIIPRMNELRARLDAFVRFAHGLIAPAAATADARFRRALEVSLSAFVLAIAISLGLAVRAARRLERDYRREQSFAETAERALAGRDEVLAVVAHDLRSPVSAIALKAGALRRNPLTANVVKQATAIEAIAMRMEQLVRMLLDAAKMEVGQFQIAPTDFQAMPAVREALDQFTPHAEAKAIQLEVDAEPRGRDLIVRADRDRVIEVLSNLIDNAIRFTRRTGRISVELRKEGEVLVVAVSDDGPGIAPEHLPHLFERFWKAESDGKRGAGLGLYIAKEIVEAHGGRIWAENLPGRGGRISFCLPLASGGEDPGRSPAAAQAAPATK